MSRRKRNSTDSALASSSELPSRVHHFMRALGIHLRVDPDQQIVAEFVFIGVAAFNILVMVALALSYAFDILLDIRGRLAAYLVCSFALSLAVPSKRPLRILRAALYFGWTSTIFTALQFIPQQDYVSFSTLYLYICGGTPLIGLLLLSKSEIAFVLWSPVLLTLALPYIFPSLPTSVHRNVLFTMLCSNVAVSVAAVFIAAQRRSVERHRHEVEKAKAVAEDLACLRAQFLSAMSHEVRTPLNGIIGLSNVLLDGPLGPGQRELVDGILTSSRVLQTLALRSLDFASLSSPQKRLSLQEEQFSLRGALEDALQSLSGTAVTQGTELWGSMQPDVPPRIVGDSERVQQMLLSALAYFLQRGTNCVSVRISTLSPERVREIEHNESASTEFAPGLLWLSMSVEDDGPALSTAELLLATEPLVPNQHTPDKSFVAAGASFELATARRLCEMMNGGLRLTSGYHSHSVGGSGRNRSESFSNVTLTKARSVSCSSSLSSLLLATPLLSAAESATTAATKQQQQQHSSCLTPSTVDLSSPWSESTLKSPFAENSSPEEHTGLKLEAWFAVRGVSEDLSSVLMTPYLTAQKSQQQILQQLQYPPHSSATVAAGPSTGENITSLSARAATAVSSGGSSSVDTPLSPLLLPLASTAAAAAAAAVTTTPNWTPYARFTPSPVTATAAAALHSAVNTSNGVMPSVAAGAPPITVRVWALSEAARTALTDALRRCGYEVESEVYSEFAQVSSALSQLMEARTRSESRHSQRSEHPQQQQQQQQHQQQQQRGRAVSFLTQDCVSGHDCDGDPVGPLAAAPMSATTSGTSAKQF